VAERLTFALADGVISTNESYKEVALTRGRKSADRVWVVRSGPQLSKFTRSAGNPKHHKARAFLVGYLGVMGPQDGVDHLLEAAHELITRRGRRDIQFCLIGNGPMFDSLQELARERGIADFVEFTGRIPDAEVIERLSSCDVCVNPDPLNPLNDKSTMNKIMEYMALERPIVQYDLLEGKRSAGGASLYVEPNNPRALAAGIEELLADPALRARMGAIGRQRMVELLEWKHQAPKLLEAYAKTLA
jgi:glycosyltransferase involved in cell wall biosynthesis